MIKNYFKNSKIFINVKNIRLLIWIIFDIVNLTHNTKNW